MIVGKIQPRKIVCYVDNGRDLVKVLDFLLGVYFRKDSKASPI